METYDFSRATHYAVSIFLIDKQRILLLKQTRSPYWLLPSGHVEDTELPHEAAVREMLEETKLNIEILENPDEKSRTKIATPLPNPHHTLMLPCRDKRDYNMVFTAKVIGGKLKIDSESQEAKWFSKEEIINNPQVGPNTRHHALKILEENPSL